MTDDDPATPPAGTPGWMVVAGMAGCVSVILGLLTLLVRDSLEPIFQRFLRWIT